LKTRIGKRFEKLAKEGRKAFIPYIMAGDPSLERTAGLIKLLEASGADIIELGVPFSDPLADGPVIQASAIRALAAGTTLRSVLAFVKDVRQWTQVPLILMTYYNPVFKFGEEAFLEGAARAGVDGLIIPDLPVHEASGLRRSASRAGIDVVFLAAPTSTEERLGMIARASSGFIYYVSITGITGAKLDNLDDIKGRIGKLKEMAPPKRKTPVAVGFGVSTPEEAGLVASFGDGVIVGSAIVKKASGGPEDELASYLKALREAIG
jgi:tryptophan synthase alpha chain